MLENFERLVFSCIVADPYNYTVMFSISLCMCQDLNDLPFHATLDDNFLENIVKRVSIFHVANFAMFVSMPSLLQAYVYENVLDFHEMP